MYAPGVKEITEAFSSSFNEIDRRFLDIARAEQLKVVLEYLNMCSHTRSSVYMCPRTGAVTRDRDEKETEQLSLYLSLY